MMSNKKCKGVVLNSTTPFGVFEDAAKARFKHQSLMHDFQDLQKETNALRSKIEAAKKRKLMLAAEVRFLRRRYEYFVKTKITGSRENDKLVHPPKQKSRKVKEAHKRILPPLLERKPKKKRNIKESAHNHNAARVLDLNRKEIMHGVNNLGSRNNSVAAFDLNQDISSSNPSGKEASLSARAPIFDLNEISMGDEDFSSHIEVLKFEEMRKSSICRNGGEGSSRVGKGKISWMDPVALRV